MAMNDPITATTRICAVYGHPIKHSASPAMQNAGIAALGLNWRYVAFDVHPDNLREAIAGAKAMRFIGLNLTVPHKLLALQMVDIIDDAAKLGARLTPSASRVATARPGVHWLNFHLMWRRKFVLSDLIRTRTQLYVHSRKTSAFRLPEKKF
jgi:hypothetical protein